MTWGSEQACGHCKGPKNGLDPTWGVGPKFTKTIFAPKDQQNRTATFQMVTWGGHPLFFSGIEPKIGYKCYIQVVDCAPVRVQDADWCKCAEASGACACFMVQHGVGVVARAPFRIPGSGLGTSLVWMLLHVLVPVIRVKGVLLPVPLSRFQVQHGVGSVSTGPFRVPGTRLGSSMKVCWSSLVSVWQHGVDADACAPDKDFNSAWSYSLNVSCWGSCSSFTLIS